MAMFKETLDSIITATASVLARSTDSLNISAFSVPQHFYDISSFANMLETASKAGYIHRTGQIITHFNSARLAYNLDNCTAVGFPPDCNLDEEENCVFVVDYGTTYLSLGFAAVGKRLYAQVAERDWTEVQDMSSEAPEHSISKMKALLEEGLPAFKPKLKVSIAPGLVGVQGAAHRARQMVMDEVFNGPERLSDHALTEEERHPPMRHSHDEL
ncbi:hypothetical protein DL98DRAFT_533101 [Cadophora sp. DSE1049]|nr:hypothetical protein DL98DRAFT_533101 [Cadophora sp. DSE1049]